MEWHEDNNKAFQPLLDYAKKDSKIDVGDYMYMGHEPNKYYYKHYMTRQYIFINQDGNRIQN